MAKKDDVIAVRDITHLTLTLNYPLIGRAIADQFYQRVKIVPENWN